MSAAIDAGALLDRSPWTGYQKLLTALAALAVIFDGFDIQILGFAVPSMMKDWHVARSAFAPVLALGLAGMAVGSPLAGYIGDRFGRRPALTGCVAFFGLCTVATAWVDSIAALALLRFLTGMGAGGAVPNAGALAAEFAPLRRKPVAVKLTIVCIPLGGMLGGLIAARVLPVYGWRTLYQIGGALPLAFAMLLWWLLPESPRFLAQRRAGWPELCRLLGRMGHAIAPGSTFEERSAPASATRVSIGALLGPAHGRDTVGLWIAFFSCLSGIYLVFGWLPTMLTAQGLDAATASAALAVFNFGGVLGVLGWAMLMSVLGSRGPMLSGALAAAGSALAILLVPMQTGSGRTLLLIALGAHIYPTSVRASGMAWAASIGRIGGLISSLCGAAIIGAGAETYWGALAAANVCAFAGLAWVRSHFPGQWAGR